MHSIFVLTLTWLLTIDFCVSDVQKFASLSPSKQSSNGANITTDSNVLISGNYWDIQLQPYIQSPYDLQLSLNNDWSFQPHKVTNIKITFDGLSLINLSDDMTLFFIFVVNNMQYISLSIHFDSNNNKYTFYNSLLIPQLRITEWILNTQKYDMRKERINNGNNNWNEFKPEYRLKALFPISFEFINDPIDNKIIYKFYSQNINIPVLIHQFSNSYFIPNTPITAYILTDEPKEHLYISSCDIYFSTTNPTPKPTDLIVINTTTKYPSQTPTNNPTNITMIKTTQIMDHSLTYIIIIISSSVISFLFGIIIGLIFCRRKKTKIHQKQNTHRHKPIPKHDIECDIECDKSDTTTHTHSPYHHHNNRLQITPDGSVENITMKIIKINSNAQSYYNCNDKTQLMCGGHNSNACSVVFVNSSDNSSDEYEDMYNNKKQCVVTPRTPMTPTNDNLILEYAAKSRVSQEKISYLNEYETNANETDMKMKETIKENENEIISENEIINDDSECNNEIIINDEIKQWLENDVELPQYLENFGSHGYESFKFIREISNKSELSEIGITVKGHQTKLMAEITKLAMIDQLEGRPRR